MRRLVEFFASSRLLLRRVLSLTKAVRNPVALSASFTLTVKQRALLAAALVALGPAVWPVRAQGDVAAVRTRADQGDPEALNSLANAYANGQGVIQNLAEAIRYYQQAAERGHAPAQFNLGMMHELGRGVPANLPNAFKFYLKAAEQGFAPAQFNVGNMYAGGLGVKQDYFEAALWFRQAAERNVPEAQYNLALAYELGRGVAKDEPSAQKWYRASAAQGYARARYNLALMLEEGRGSNADPAGAIEFYRAAALQNYAPAQNNLGILLAEGRGAPADLSQAYAWLALAVENGAKATGRDIVAQQFTSAQLAEANVAVAKLRSQLGTRDIPASPQASSVAAVVAPPPASTQARPAVPPGGVDPDLNARLATAQADLANLRSEHSRLSAAAQGLSREKAALEQRLAATEATRADLTTKATAASDAVAKAAQVEEARAKLALELGANQAALADARAAAARLTEENQRLKSVQSPAAPAADTAALTARLEKAQDLINDARSENARLISVVETAQRERASFDQRLAASTQLLERERTALQQRVAVAESAAQAAAAAGSAAPVKTAPDPALESLRAKVDQLTRETGALRTEKDQAQGQITELAAQLAAAKANAAAAVPAVSATASNVPSASDDNRLAKLLADNNRLNDEVRRSTIQLTTLNRQLRTAQDKLAKAGETTAPAGAAIADETKVVDLARQLDELRAANQKLAEENRRLAAASPSAPSDDTARLVAQLASAQTELAASRSSQTQAQQALADAAKSRDAIALEKEALEKRLVAASASAAPAVDPAELRKLRDELARQQIELTSARQTAEERQRQLTAAESAGAAKVAQLTAELDQTKSALSATSAAPRIDPSQLTALQTEFAAAQKSLASERETQGRLQASLDEANRALAQRGKSEQELVIARAEVADRQTKLLAAQQALGNATKSVEAMAAEKSVIEKRLAAATAVPAANPDELRKLREELSVHQADLASTRRAADAAQRQLLAAESTSAAKLAEIGAELEQTKKALAAAANVPRVDPARLATVQSELTSAQQALAGERDNQAKLQARLEEANRALGQRGQVDRDLVAARTTLTDLQAKLSAAQQAQVESKGVAAQLAALTSRHEALAAERDRLVAAQRTQTVDRESLEKLNAQFDNASRTIVELTQRNESLQKDMEVAKQSVAAALAAQAAAVKAAPTDAMRLEMQTLQDQVRSLETQLEEDRKNSAREMSSLASQLQRAREASKSLSEANRSLLDAKSSEDSSAKAELDQIAARLRVATDANEKLRTEQSKLTAANEQLLAEKSSAERVAVDARKAAAAPSQERDALRAQLEDMFSKLSTTERQVAQQKQTAETARVDAERARADYAALQAKYADVAKSSDQHGASVAELTGLNEKLTAERTALEKQFAQSRLFADQNRSELAELRARVTSSTEANDRQLALAKEAAAAAEKLQTQVKDVTSQLAAAQAENARLSSMGNTTAGLRNELATAKAKLAEATKAAESHGSSVAELTGQNEKIAAEKTAAQQQLEQARASAEQMRSELADLRSRVNAGNRAFEQQVVAVNEAATAGEKLQGQVKDLTAQLAALRSENARLGSATDTAGALRNELNDLKVKLAESQKAAELQAATVAELTGAQEKSSGGLKDLQAQLATLRAENTRLAQVSEQAKLDAEQKASSSASAVAAQLATVQRDLAAQRAENARVTDSLQAVERDRVTRVAQLQQENAAIAARLRQAQGTLDQIASAARLINGGSSSPIAALPPATPTIVSQNASAPVATQARVHVVQDGDSLTRISSRYYGTTGRWQEIYDANRDVLKGENALRLGQRLKIP